MNVLTLTLWLLPTFLILGILATNKRNYEDLFWLRLIVLVLIVSGITSNLWWLSVWAHKIETRVEKLEQKE